MQNLQTPGTVSFMGGAETTSPAGPANLFAVKGLVALVTGGGSGIGLMMAKALAHAGAARVYILGRRMDVLQEAVASIGRSSVVPLYCDVTSRVSLESAVNIIQNDPSTGYLNLVVCNAGIGGPQGPPIQRKSEQSRDAPPAILTLDEFRDSQFGIDLDEYTNTFRVNCTSVWYTAMAFLKLLDEGNKRGNVEQSSQLIVTSSIGGFNRAVPGGWAYGQSKAAATHMVRQLAVALPTWGIRANCIAPGLFPSEMSAPIVQRAQGNIEEGVLRLEKSVVPLGRMGDESDMAGQILYLASRAGAYNNGTIIVVDGGRLGTFPSSGY